MRWVHRLLLRHAEFYRRFVKYLKELTPKWFGGISVYVVLVSLVNEFLEESLLNRASALAYSFMLALFPAIIFLFTLIAYIPVNDFQDTLLNVVQTILPTNAYLAFQSTIEDIIKNQNAKLLSVGFISALYFATNGVGNLMRAFNDSSLILEKRTWLKRRVVATTLTVVISFALLAAIVVLIVGEHIITNMQEHIASESSFWIYAVTLSRWLIIIAIFFFSISLLYRYGPAHKLRWKFLNPGSVLATMLAVLTSIGFTYYINNFGQYNKVYGSIGTLIVVMIWLYINSLILLIGFELNANIDLAKRKIKVEKPRFNTFRRQNFTS
ncbi:YihY/virulence factor BrkB family protein [Mucilaginibacter auburnensis]|uniref:Membrane protein n=1 Tax=Mucilaginibacter auburnensis TaxID=1457233 RepID=A0A2H9VKY8_9SPHI|nr:YihY/virulence factor BrkB family protein [Mucilaginibacter auburnensis]PJJ79009.1 membrane protein [Mucilaginibacter auburnensis]